MFNVGPAEIIVILLVVLIVFGPKRLPEIGKTVGKSLREFQRATQDLKDEFMGQIDMEEGEPEAPSPQSSSGPAPSSGPSDQSPAAPTQPLPATDQAPSPDGATPAPSGDGAGQLGGASGA